MSCILARATATTHTYALSLPDALPISVIVPVSIAGADVLLSGRLVEFARRWRELLLGAALGAALYLGPFAASRWVRGDWQLLQDRKSTRLNSSHVEKSYAVFCLKKKEQGADDGSEAETRGSRYRLLRVPGCRPRRGLPAEQVHGRRAQGAQQEGGREDAVL